MEQPIGLTPGLVITEKYEIIRLIGYGGVGEVYLAKDQQIERLVAIKLLSKSLSDDPEHKLRFTRESRAISSLNHPNIVTVYEIGNFSDQLFIATEYIEGKTLREVINISPLELKDFFTVAIQATQALSVAHQNGIIHRDLKLENFILRSDDLLKIVDFGLAKISESHSAVILGSEAGFQTQAGIVLGTPNYMSPEQAKGEELDARSDIFSLGAVFYELLTGRQTFDGDTLVQILVNVAVVPTPPLPTSVPPKLRALVVRMLQKTPAARYQSMQMILADLLSLKDELLVDKTPTKRTTFTALESPFVQAVKSTNMNKKTGFLAMVDPEYELFVGRDKELQFFRTQLHELGKETLLPIVVTGDSGIGKTSLLKQFQGVTARQEVLSALIRLSELDNFAQSYQWVFPMLASLLGFGLDDSFMSAEGELARRVSARAKARYGVTLPKEVLGQPLNETATEKWKIFEIINNVCQQLLKNHNLVLLFDNLHWANELSLELIGYLLRNLKSDKLLMVTTADLVEIKRKGSLLSNWFSQQNLYTLFETMELKPFSEAEMRAYFEGVFYQIEISDREINYIHQITDGNPYYLNEIVRILINNGKIHLVGKLWHCDSLENLTLPNTIGTALLYKIEKCSEELKSLITQASVLGDSFSFELLVELVPFEGDKLKELLAAAEKENLVFEERSSILDEYKFQSTALRQVLYDSLSTRQKKRLHIRAAAAIKELYNGKLKQSFSSLTYHYHAAGEWQEAFSFGQQAMAQYFEQSAWGEVAKQGLLVTEAIDALQRTDELTDTDLDTVVDIKNNYANALGNLGRLEFALEQAQSALAIAEKKKSNLLIAQSCVTLCHLGWYASRFTDINNWSEKGLQAALLAQSKFWQQQLYFQSARAKLRTHSYPEALAIMEKACELAKEINHPRFLAHSQTFQGLLLFLTSRFREGFSCIDNAIDSLRKLGDKYFECRAYTMKAVMLLFSYQKEELEEFHKQSVEFSRQIGWRVGEVYQHFTLSRIYLEDVSLNVEKAEDLLERVIALATEIGERASVLMAKRGLAKISALQGDYESAINQLKQILVALKNLGELPEQMGTLEMLAEIQDLVGDTKSALEFYKAALEIAKYLQSTYFEWKILLGQAKCFYKLGHLQQALEALQTAKEQVNKLRAEFKNKQEGKYFFQATQNVYELAAQIEREIKTK